MSTAGTDVQPGKAETRMIAMGSVALTQGFALVGFETWPGADPSTVARVLDELMDDNQRALVLLEPDLARCDCPQLRRARADSDRIVVVEVPPLDAPDSYHPLIEDLVTSVLGANALEDSRGL